jgi:hypothetical protein
MGKLPASLFYWGDWRRNPELSFCSKAAKGVWMDMLAIAFECEERGVLATGGRPWADEEIAGVIGGDVSANLTCIRELLSKGVARRNGRGAIFSGRMVREEQARIERKPSTPRVRKFREKQKLLSSSDETVSETLMKRVSLETENVVSSSSSSKEPELNHQELRSEASFAAGYVLDHLGWTGKWARVTYEEQIVKQLKIGGKNAQQVAEEMVESWRLYAVASQVAKYKHTVAKFFTEGIWCDRTQWGEANGNGNKTDQRAAETEASLERLRARKQSGATVHSITGEVPER